MDINMPILNGLQATRIIKERFSYVKIVIVTVSDDASDLFKKYFMTVLATKTENANQKVERLLQHRQISNFTLSSIMNRGCVVATIRATLLTALFLYFHQMISRMNMMFNYLEFWQF
jgi:DNA-binding NarL/FixJ family response regulator